MFSHFLIYQLYRQKLYKNNFSFIEVITDDNFNENEAIDLAISDGQK